MQRAAPGCRVSARGKGCYDLHNKFKLKYFVLEINLDL